MPFSSTLSLSLPCTCIVGPPEAAFPSNTINRFNWLYVPGGICAFVSTVAKTIWTAEGGGRGANRAGQQEKVN